MEFERGKKNKQKTFSCSIRATPKNSERIASQYRAKAFGRPAIRNRKSSSEIELLPSVRTQSQFYFTRELALSSFESFDPARGCVISNRCSMYRHSIGLWRLDRCRRPMHVLCSERKQFSFKFNITTNCRIILYSTYAYTAG